MQTADIWSKSLFPGIADILIIMAYLVLLIMVAIYVQNKNIEKEPTWRFLVPGLLAKIGGALALCLIYTLYYRGGGDTTGYYRSSEALVNLMFHDFSAYLRILMGDMSREALSAFNASTGSPWYTRDTSSFAIVRITSVFTLLGFKNYFTTSILFASFFFMGFWRLYVLFSRLYPDYHKAFAWAILFFPSVLFWGSGISKDTVTLSFTGWFVYAFFHVFVLRKGMIINIIMLLLSGYVIINVKAYVLVALLPGALVWLSWDYIKRIPNTLLRFMAAPAMITAFIILGIGLLSVFSEQLGDYGSIEGIVNKAIITYEDHSRAVQYGVHYYQLGEFDGTIGNFLSKAPAAISAGLFRPFVWEAGNPVMLLAALENLLFFGILLMIILKSGLRNTLKTIFSEPVAMFCLSFAIVFAFAVGISTANFGALVRLKIPLLPFLGVGLGIIYYKAKEMKRMRE